MDEPVVKMPVSRQNLLLISTSGSGLVLNTWGNFRKQDNVDTVMEQSSFLVLLKSDFKK